MKVDARLEALGRLVEVVDRLRAEDGCPWDRKQTLESMVPNVLEEAAEVADAIASGEAPSVREELGDLLMNVVLVSRIAEQDGVFGLAEVARDIADKLVRRHPHVFGDRRATDADDALRHWERSKREEHTDGSRDSWMDGVPTGLSSLSRAGKLVKRAGTAGFRWPTADDAWRKFDEEVGELREVRGHDGPERADEVGDVLFSLVCACRQVGLDPDLALRRACDKFERRFRHVEQTHGRELTSVPLDVMLETWRNAKRLDDVQLKDDEATDQRRA